MKTRFRCKLLCLSASIVTLVAGGLAPVQAKNPKEIEASPEYKRVAEEVRFLASDEMEGRGPDTKGLQRAADYIRDEYKRMGLKSGTEDGSYFQSFPFPLPPKPNASKTSLVLSGPDGKQIELKLGERFSPAAGQGKASADLVFVGYGITAPDLKYNDYDDIDVEGKIVVMIRREPQQDMESSPFAGTSVSSHSYIRTKAIRAKENKALAVIFVNDPHSTKNRPDSLTPAGSFNSSSSDIPFAHITIESLDELLKASPITTESGDELDSVAAIEAEIDKSLKPLSQPMAGWTGDLNVEFEKRTVDVANVVGVLEGAGPHADETIVIGGHYDHLGYGGRGSRAPGVFEVHNGADDNATGTSAILELARRMVGQDQPPGRRIVFIAFSVEEQGLIGAKYYVEHPLFPLEKTVCMYNFDMIGQVRDSKLLLYGTGTAEEFDDLIEDANAEVQLNLQKTPSVMAASDHWPFYQEKVPCFHVFSGTTKEYHTPDDDFETLNMIGVMRTIDFSENLINAIASLPDTPTFVNVSPVRRPRRGIPNLGFVPDYSSSEAVTVKQVTGDSPAAKAGLQPGDKIVQIGETDIDNQRAMIRALRNATDGKPITITIERDGKQTELKIER